MDILYREIPDEIYNLIADTQCELKKQKKRDHSHSEVITILLKNAYIRKDVLINFHATNTTEVIKVDIKK